MPEIDYTKEIDKLIERDEPTQRELAFELLQLKLEEIPLLHERIELLEEECRRLREEIQVLECEIDCGIRSESGDESFEDTESEYSGRTEESSEGIESDSEHELGCTAVTEQSEDFWFPSHWFVDVSAIYVPSFPSFPIDILHVVFEHLLPDMEALDFSTPGGPDGPLCQSIRMKKSLAHVCKAWHSVALGYLYRDVVFRRANQIVDFARTIRADRNTFGSRVRRLVFACLLTDCVSDDIHNAVIRILYYCRSLSQVSFAGFQDMHKFGGDVILQRVEYSVPKTWRTQVQVEGASFTVWRVHIYWPALTSLRSLEISLWSKQADAYTSALTLPHLDTLILRHSRAFIQEYGVSLRYPVTWVMPSLKHLRFRCPIRALPRTRGFWKFLDKHGPNLLGLSFGPVQSHRSVIEDDAIDNIVTILTKCPSLTHLVFQPTPDMGLTPLSLPGNIRRIDVILPATEDTRDLVDDALTKSALYFPGRKGVRFFEDLLVARLPNLPFSSLLPWTRAEYETLGLKSPLEIDGYKVHVVPRRYNEMEVANLLFHEAAWE